MKSLTKLPPYRLTGKKIAIVCSRFNSHVTDRLIAGAQKGLKACGIVEGMYSVYFVPGAFEIPLKTQQLIKKGRYTGVIALGCILEGDTDHYRTVCDGVTYGIQRVSLDTGVPVMFGILMCKTNAQALARTKPDSTNKGHECAVALAELIG